MKIRIQPLSFVQIDLLSLSKKKKKKEFLAVHVHHVQCDLCLCGAHDNWKLGKSFIAFSSLMWMGHDCSCGAYEKRK